MLNYTIYPNNFGPGLCIAHYGTLVVNPDARIGKNCRTHVCVNIGRTPKGVPMMGDNVYIGPGAKIFGGITIGDHVAIGANAVVFHSTPSHCTLVGNPARIVRLGGQRVDIPLSQWARENE